MSTDVEELLVASADHAPLPSAEAEERAAEAVRAIVARRPPPRRSGRRRACVALAAACLVALAGGGAAWLHGRGGRAGNGAPVIIGVNSNPGLNGPAPAPLGRNPFAAHGRPVSLAAASSVVGYHVLVPSGGGRWKAWVSGREVILEDVAAGIVISQQPVAGCCYAPGVETRAGLERMSHSLPGTRVITVQGRPGLLAPPDRAGRGFVQVALAGIEIAVMSRTPGTPAADLVRIAGSLR